MFTLIKLVLGVANLNTLTAYTKQVFLKYGNMELTM